MCPEVGDDRPRLVGSDLGRKPAFRQRAQRIEVGNLRPKAGVAVPDSLSLFDQRLGIGEPARLERQRPFVGIGELAEALHRGALEALVDDLIEGKRAALAGAVAIGKGDRRRIELPPQRRLRIAVRSVAAGAVLPEELGAAVEIGSPPRAERNRISLEQVPAEAARHPRNLRRRRLALDGPLQGRAFRNQPRLLRRRRQLSEILSDGGGEFAHFRIFGGADDLSVANRAGVIDRDIVEQPPARLDVARGRGRRRRRRGEDEEERCEQQNTAKHGRGLSLLRMIINRCF